MGTGTRQATAWPSRPALLRGPACEVYATDCQVMEHVVECLKHSGRFDIRDGRALGAPVCVNLKTYPAKVEGGQVLVQLGG